MFSILFSIFSKPLEISCKMSSQLQVCRDFEVVVRLVEVVAWLVEVVVGEIEVVVEGIVVDEVVRIVVFG
jgi:hypothetical protein